MNRKGYLTVEVVVATVIAVGISFFLINIVMKILNKTDDLTHEISYFTVHSAISKVLEEDLSSLQLSELSLSSNEVIITYNLCPEDEEAYLCETQRKKISIKEENGKKSLIYGKILEDNSYDDTDANYYIREIPNELTPGTISFENNANIYPDANTYDSLLIMKIPLTNIFENKNYDINIAIPYSQDQIHLNVS